MIVVYLLFGLLAGVLPVLFLLGIQSWGHKANGEIRSIPGVVAVVEFVATNFGNLNDRRKRLDDWKDRKDFWTDRIGKLGVEKKALDAMLVRANDCVTRAEDVTFNWVLWYPLVMYGFQLMELLKEHPQLEGEILSTVRAFADYVGSSEWIDARSDDSFVAPVEEVDPGEEMDPDDDEDHDECGPPNYLTQYYIDRFPDPAEVIRLEETRKFLRSYGLEVTEGNLDAVMGESCLEILSLNPHLFQLFVWRLRRLVEKYDGTEARREEYFRKMQENLEMRRRDAFEDSVYVEVIC